jgi:hypothetical protein
MGRGFPQSGLGDHQSARCWRPDCASAHTGIACGAGNFCTANGVGITHSFWFTKEEARGFDDGGGGGDGRRIPRHDGKRLYFPCSYLYRCIQCMPIFVIYSWRAPLESYTHYHSHTILTVCLVDRASNIDSWLVVRGGRWRQTSAGSDDVHVLIAPLNARRRDRDPWQNGRRCAADKAFFRVATACDNSPRGFKLYHLPCLPP